MFNGSVLARIPWRARTYGTTPGGSGSSAKKAQLCSQLAAAGGHGGTLRQRQNPGVSGLCRWCEGQEELLRWSVGPKWPGKEVKVANRKRRRSHQPQPGMHGLCSGGCKAQAETDRDKARTLSIPPPAWKHGALRPG